MCTPLVRRFLSFGWFLISHREIKVPTSASPWIVSEKSEITEVKFYGSWFYSIENSRSFGRNIKWNAIAMCTFLRARAIHVYFNDVISKKEKIKPRSISTYETSNLAQRA